MMNQEKGTRHTSILAVFASPQGSDPLRLGAEDRVIRECLNLSRFRNNISLEVLHAATIHDVRRALLGGDYRIIQFSGHGTGQELVLENALGEPQLVPQEALAECLSAYSPPIECVILNACYTGVQVKLISLGVPFTIGINGAISDAAATEFTRGFYDAIGAGKDIEFAFQEGCRCVKLMGLCSGFEPVLFTETRPQQQAEIKIVSQHQVQFQEEEEEEGFLDYILDGTESFETVAEIAARIAARTNELGEDTREDVAELENLSDPQDRASVREYKRIVDRSAQRMEAFARQLDEETPLFREAYSRAIDYYGKAATLLTTEFDADTAGQIEGALNAVKGLEDSIESARGGLVGFRRSIADLPRMTKKLNQAKRRCLAALDNFDREMEAGLQLTREVEVVMARLLN
jgi:hypothetical protein